MNRPTVLAAIVPLVATRVAAVWSAALERAGLLPGLARSCRAHVPVGLPHSTNLGLEARTDRYLQLLLPATFSRYLLLTATYY